MHEASEFDKLLEIYNRYPITELTIHPRVRQDFYKGKVRESDFAAALPRCSMPCLLYTSCACGDPPVCVAVRYL